MKIETIFKILRYLAMFLAGGLSALGITGCSSLLVNTGTQVPSVNMPTMSLPDTQIEQTDSTIIVDVHNA